MKKRKNNKIFTKKTILLNANQYIKIELEKAIFSNSDQPKDVLLDAGIYDLTGFDMVLPENIQLSDLGEMQLLLKPLMETILSHHLKVPQVI